MVQVLQIFKVNLDAFQSGFFQDGRGRKPRWLKDQTRPSWNPFSVHLRSKLSYHMLNYIQLHFLSSLGKHTPIQCGTPSCNFCRYTPIEQLAFR